MNFQTSGSSSPSDMSQRTADDVLSSPPLSERSPTPPLSSGFSFHQTTFPPPLNQVYPPDLFDAYRCAASSPESDFSSERGFQGSGLFAPPPSPLPSCADPLHVVDGLSLNPQDLPGPAEEITTKEADDILLSLADPSFVEMIANARSLSLSDVLQQSQLDPATSDLLIFCSENEDMNAAAALWPPSFVDQAALHHPAAASFADFGALLEQDTLYSRDGDGVEAWLWNRDRDWDWDALAESGADEDYTEFPDLFLPQQQSQQFRLSTPPPLEHNDYYSAFPAMTATTTMVTSNDQFALLAFDTWGVGVESMPTLPSQQQQQQREGSSWLDLYPDLVEASLYDGPEEVGFSVHHCPRCGWDGSAAPARSPLASWTPAGPFAQEM